VLTEILHVSKSPVADAYTLGALTLPTFIRIDEAASLLNTATNIVSIPFKLPSLSMRGTNICIEKLAIGLIDAYWLLLGVRYGSDGIITTLFAIGVAGGKLKVE
jgi:hypothetical protein